MIDIIKASFSHAKRWLFLEVWSERNQLHLSRQCLLLDRTRLFCRNRQRFIRKPVRIKDLFVAFFLFKRGTFEVFWGFLEYFVYILDVCTSCIGDDNLSTWGSVEVANWKLRRRCSKKKVGRLESIKNWKGLLKFIGSLNECLPQVWSGHNWELRQALWSF